MNVATPEAFSVDMAITLAPSSSTAEPVGVVPDGEAAVTVAVNVRGWPKDDAPADEGTTEVLLAWGTTAVEIVTSPCV